MLPTSESPTSHLPALALLKRLGWIHLSKEEALKLRANREKEVLLKPILRQKLAELNRVSTRGQTLPFSEGAIEDAMQALTASLEDGLVRTNEKVWELLRLGKAIQQTVDGEKKSFTLRFIDWEKPENNTFHITEEFTVATCGGSVPTRRPDLVGFVNGIPFLVIECKRPALPGGKDPLAEAISQQLRNQGVHEIPQLFHFAQMVLALSANQAKYAATGTPLKFWQCWREQEFSEAQLAGLLGGSFWDQSPVDEEAPPYGSMRLAPRPPALMAAEGDKAGRIPTEQDRLLHAVCTPSRLLDLVRNYTVFDGGERKIARYQQFFAIRKVLDRLDVMMPEGCRTGGVVWHTQGSGKSLTMVMLAEGILEKYARLNPRVVLVTDRVDLDDQIYKTFVNSGVELAQAESGTDLKKLLAGTRSRVITTLVHKFKGALTGKEALTEDPNVFVLIDETHRTQAGSLHAAMKIALPKACCLGFTGTPILKGDKKTVDRIGGIIDRYTIRDAVDDKAVVPLVYEGRHIYQRIDAPPIDEWFENYTTGLSTEQKAQLKRKFAQKETLNAAEQKIRMVAWDISNHFRENFQGKTPFKGQLVAPSKQAAIEYKRFLDEFGVVKSEVLISQPDTREGHAEVDEVAEVDTETQDDRRKVQVFWEKMMKRFGSPETYRNDLISRFKGAESPEIIIVVDMLLTGFDAPRNAVLYLARPLREHTLLQAIARVNRIHEGKDFGLIVDYYGVLGNLGEALDMYAAFEGKFDAEDVQDVMLDIRKIVAELPGLHAAIWDLFATVKNKKDREALERLLGNEDLRHDFHDRVGEFARKLKMALSSGDFHRRTADEVKDRYRADLKFFLDLRASAALRYAEKVDFRQYEGPIQKLLDTFVGAAPPQIIVQPVDIFDQEAFAKEVAGFESAKSKAEVILNRTDRTIHERMEEDPVLYRRFSDMLREIRDAYEQGRLDDKEYLRRAEDACGKVRERKREDGAPASLAGRDLARTYFDLAGEVFAKEGIKADPEWSAKLALRVDEVIARLKIVGWQQNTDIQNQMKTAIEDEWFEMCRERGLSVGFDVMDHLLDAWVDVARRRNP